MYLISPSKVIRGNNAWYESLKHVQKITNTPLVLGRSKATNNIRTNLMKDLNRENLNAYSFDIKYDCCYEDLERAYEFASRNKCDAIIAAGGGKVLDAGKLLADSLTIPCITVPLSASTCAGWTALSNIYTPKGQFIKDVSLKSCPEILIYDYSFIRTAPLNTLRSGIADSLAKWYESSITSLSNSDGVVQQAIQISRVLRDQLFIDGLAAYKNQNEKNNSWRNVVDANGLTAGLIGGIGGEKCRTAAAHAIHNSITQLQSIKKPLHGEIVGVGILIQLSLEESKNKNRLANQSSNQLLKFMKDLNLPTTIAELGINVFEKDNLERIANFTCRKESEIHFLPFSVNSNDIISVISEFEANKIII
ncbi:MAG: oxidoreductase [Prochlorococcus sp. SP3034]|nr:oxidoreductase [Prochlorococcus sp. SP3034]|tara:strand:- start:7292 stop:8383 length:1092 start_codon:yes stop_codon:yes gene_type:complete